MISPVKLPSVDCNWTWLPVYKWVQIKEAITWASFNPYLCCHPTTQGHNELSIFRLCQTALYIPFMISIFDKCHSGWFLLTSGKYQLIFSWWTMFQNSETRYRHFAVATLRMNTVVAYVSPWEFMYLVSSSWENWPSYIWRKLSE